jgi:hypothetical protein
MARLRNYYSSSSGRGLRVDVDRSALTELKEKDVIYNGSRRVVLRGLIGTTLLIPVGIIARADDLEVVGSQMLILIATVGWLWLGEMGSPVTRVRTNGTGLLHGSLASMGSYPRWSPRHQRYRDKDKSPQRTEQPGGFHPRL